MRDFKLSFEFYPELTEWTVIALVALPPTLIFTAVTKFC